MKGALFDANILIDALSGVEGARALIASHPDGHISAVTWVEVMTGVSREGAEPGRAAQLVSGFTFLPVDERIAGEAASLMRRYPLSLPDALIRATARVHDLLLITRDRKLAATTPDALVPY